MDPETGLPRRISFAGRGPIIDVRKFNQLNVELEDEKPSVKNG